MLGFPHIREAKVPMAFGKSKYCELVRMINQAELSGNQMKVLHWLLTCYADNGSSRMIINQTSLSYDLRMCVAEVNRTLKALCEKGILVKVSDPPGSKKFSFRLNVSYARLFELRTA